jgi:hypothetical protein
MKSPYHNASFDGPLNAVTVSHCSKCIAQEYSFEKHGAWIDDNVVGSHVKENHNQAGERSYDIALLTDVLKAFGEPIPAPQR